MKKLSIKIIAVCMVFILLSGCTAKDKNDSDTQESAIDAPLENMGGPERLSSAGRYIEEEVDIPDKEITTEYGIVPVHIYALATTEDGSVVMYTDNGYYISRDGADSWEKREIPGMSLDTVFLISIGKKGDFFVGGFEESEKETETMTYMAETKYLYIDPEGNTFTPSLDLPTYKEEVDRYYAEEPSIITESDSDSVDTEENPAVVNSDETVSGESNVDSTDTEENPAIVKSDDMVLDEGFDDVLSMEYDEDMIQTPSTVKLLSNEILLAELSNVLYMFDPKTGDIVQKIELTPEDGQIETFEMVGDDLVVITSAGVLTFNMTTGDELNVESVFEPSLNFGNNTDMTYSWGSLRRLLIPSSFDESVFLADSSGIFRYPVNGSVLEQLVAGEDTFLSDRTKSMIAFTDMPEYHFLIAYFCTDTGEVRLLRYRYSNEVPLEAQTDLLIYSLYDNRSLRQAVLTYRKENPEVNAIIQVGIAEDSGITETDALITLTTEIMAEKGPDILLLDGMSVSNLSENGILLNLYEILDEMDDHFFGNIIKMYEADGDLHAIPTRFAIPYMIGERSVIDGYTALSDISDHLEKWDGYGLGFYSPNELTELLYGMIAPTLFSEGKGIEEEVLTDFYLQVQRLYTRTLSKLRSEEIDLLEANTFNPDLRFSLMDSVFNLLEDEKNIAFSFLTSIDKDLGSAQAILEKNPELLAKPFTIDDKIVFTPSSIIGINAKTKYIEESIGFLHVLISKEIQSGSGIEGLPVNRSAMDELIKQPSNPEENVTALIYSDGDILSKLDVTFPTEEQIHDFLLVIEDAEIPSVTDQRILEMIKEPLPFLMNDEKSPDAAAADVITKINLYLAE